MDHVFIPIKLRQKLLLTEETDFLCLISMARLECLQPKLGAAVHVQYICTTFVMFCYGVSLSQTHSMQ